MYEAVRGYHLTRSELVGALENHFKDSMVILHVNGFAKMLMFQRISERAMTVLQMVKNDENEEDMKLIMKKISKDIKRDVSEMQFDEMNNKRQ